MLMDPNHDIVPTLRMMDGLLMTKAADEIERLRFTAVGRTENFDRAIRRMRRRYFDNNPANTWLAIAFNDLLRLNGTFEEDTEANARREAVALGA